MEIFIQKLLKARNLWRSSFRNYLKQGIYGDLHSEITLSKEFMEIFIQKLLKARNLWRSSFRNYSKQGIYGDLHSEIT